MCPWGTLSRASGTGSGTRLALPAASKSPEFSPREVHGEATAVVPGGVLERFLRRGPWEVRRTVFLPVARHCQRKLRSAPVLLNGEPVSSKGSTFYLDFSQRGKRRQESVGTVPREGLEAWRTKLAVLTGLIEPEE